MESGGARTVCILRRMKRISIGHWAWNEYTPAKALPEELRFDLLDENEKPTAQFTLGKIRPIKGVDISTPWGPAKIDWPKGGTRLSIGEKELARVKGAFLKSEVNFVFPNGVTMAFRPKKEHKDDIEFTDGRGSVGVYRETGVLPEGHPGLKVQMTKEEIKRLPKHERPRSIESREYVQFRVMTWGALPVKLDDLVAALTILAILGTMADEMPTHG